jgi:phosphohistidine phosphatase
MEQAINSGQWNSDVTITDALYETTPGSVLQLIRSFSDQDKVVMLVGHEPTWSELASGLSDKHISFNTAGISHIQFSKDHWADINPCDGDLMWYEHP